MLISFYKYVNTQFKKNPLQKRKMPRQQLEQGNSLAICCMNSLLKSIIVRLSNRRPMATVLAITYIVYLQSHQLLFPVFPQTGHRVLCTICFFGKTTYQINQMTTVPLCRSCSHARVEPPYLLLCLSPSPHSSVLALHHLQAAFSDGRSGYSDSYYGLPHLQKA